MNRLRQKRAALFFLILALLIAAPLVATWRAVRQERMNRALIAAVKRNDTATVVCLLNRGADANYRDEPIRWFSFWQTLVKVVRGSKDQPSDAPTPLLITLEDRLPDFKPPPENLPLVQALLDHGAPVNQTDENGGTPLFLAIDSGKNATAHLFLARGADVNEADAPLVLAVKIREIEIGVIADLLDRGTDVNQRYDGGPTALFAAVQCGRPDVVRLLLARHADVTVGYQVKRHKALTPLGWALQDDSPEGRQIARLLKAAGAR